MIHSYLETGTSIATYTPVVSSILGTAEVLYALALSVYLKITRYFNLGDFAKLKLNQDTLLALRQPVYSPECTEALILNKIQPRSDALLRIRKSELSIQRHLFNGCCRITWIGGVLLPLLPYIQPQPHNAPSNSEDVIKTSSQNAEARVKEDPEEDSDDPFFATVSITHEDVRNWGSKQQIKAKDLQFVQEWVREIRKKQSLGIIEEFRTEEPGMIEVDVVEDLS